MVNELHITLRMDCLFSVCVSSNS